MIDNRSVSNLKVMDNPRDFSNIEYMKVFDFLNNLKNLVDKILYSHSDYFVSDISAEESALLSEEDIAILNYCDDLDTIHWGEYNNITVNISAGVYFNRVGLCTLFMNTLESIKVSLAEIQNIYNCGLEVNFNTKYRKSLERDYKNLNYCIMDSFDLFAILNGGIMSCIKEYTIINRIDIFCLVENMYNYYLDHRPSLPLFDRYPEYAAIIEEKVDADLFFDLVQYSNFLKKQEVIDIVEGKLEVTESFCEELEEKFRIALYGE